MRDFFDRLSADFGKGWELTFFIILALVLGILLRFAFYFLLKFYIWRTEDFWAKSVKRRMHGPFYIMLPCFFMLYFLPLIDMTKSARVLFSITVEVLFIIGLAWFIVKLILVVEDVLLHAYTIEKSDNFFERKLYTQIKFIKKLLFIGVITVGAALILMRFEGMRRIGTGLLTSAGIAGVIVGFAAQRSIANILAGLQIAFTQPIRIDDAVVVEGEWGRIEEIRMTYVVVKIWDQRRMILPITYFIEKPFQNWTRTTADITGAVHFYLDYSMPLAPLREELERLVKGHPLWDGDTCVLQVTDCKKRTMEVRCLMTARNSGDAFDLRVYVREHLIDFIQKKYPYALPKTRNTLEENHNQKDDFPKLPGISPEGVV